MRGRWAQELGRTALAPALLRWAMAPMVALGMAVAPAMADEESEPETPRIYRWIDENGIAHYTTDPKRIPEPLRSRVGELEPRSLDRRDLKAQAPPPPALPPTIGPAAEPAPGGVAATETPPSAGSTTAAETAPSAGGTTAAETAPSAGGTTAAETPPSPGPAPAVGGPTAPEPPVEPTATAPRPAPGTRVQRSLPSPPDAWASLDRPPGGEPTSGRSSLQDQIDELDLRIAVLRADIAADEETLKRAIGNPDTDSLASGEDPEFQEVARRLPERLAELRELRDQRAKLESE